MPEITIITAADEKFKKMVEVTEMSSKMLRYNTVVYDLGGLGYGKPFEARISIQPGAKIPSKPMIINDALNNVKENDVVLWLDADAVIWNRVDEIIDYDFDIAVTVRKKKELENDLPINAGVVFVRKTKNIQKFMDKWMDLCITGKSDQVELNKLCQVTTKDFDKTVKREGIKVKVLHCDIYNNFYFKKPQLHAKITHYKSKHRAYWPRRTLKKIPKNPTQEIIMLNTSSIIDNKGD